MSRQVRRDEHEFEPDLDDLVGECARQADLYFWAAEDLTEAKFERDVAERRLEVRKAQVAHEVRENPGNFGLADKPTVDAVKEAVTRSVEKEAQALISAEREVGHRANRVKALEHKKSELGDLVSLKLGGLHAAPKVRKDVEDEVDRRKDQAAYGKPRTREEARARDNRR